MPGPGNGNDSGLGVGAQAVHLFPPGAIHLGQLKVAQFFGHRITCAPVLSMVSPPTRRRSCSGVHWWASCLTSCAMAVCPSANSRADTWISKRCGSIMAAANARLQPTHGSDSFNARWWGGAGRGPAWASMGPLPVVGRRPVAFLCSGQGSAEPIPVSGADPSGDPSLC